MGGVLLTTAAELSGGATDVATKIAPELFHQGMLVRHPEYGLGEIVALSGSGAQRRATVEFAGIGQKSFVLAKSPLHPLKSLDG